MVIYIINTILSDTLYKIMCHYRFRISIDYDSRFSSMTNRCESTLIGIDNRLSIKNRHILVWQFQKQKLIKTYEI